MNLRHTKLLNQTIKLCCAAMAALAVAAAAGRGALAASDIIPASGPPEVQAPSAVVLDAQTGFILYEKQKDAVHYPASITKMMTALLTMEYASAGGVNKMDERVHFSHDAVFSIPVDSSHIAMDENESLTIREALYGAMLASANEVSNALAEHVGGTRDAFAGMMTARAKDLGAKSTSFKNPHGLYDPEHYSTAYDMALIMRELVKYPDIVDIMRTTHYDLPPTERQPESRPLDNTNKMIQPWSVYYDESVVCGKTGYTKESLHTLTTYGKQGDASVIVVIMNAETSKIAYTDTSALLDYAFNQYLDLTVVDSASYRKTAAVAEGGSPAAAALGAAEDIKLTLPRGTLNMLLLTDDIPDEIAVSMAPGDVAGKLIVSINGEVMGQTDLIALEAVTAPPAEAAFAETNAEDSSEGAPGGFGIMNFLLNHWLAFAAAAFVFLLALLFSAIMLRSRARRRARRSSRYGLKQEKGQYPYRGRT